MLTGLVNAFWRAGFWWKPRLRTKNGRTLMYFKQKPTAEDGSGGETYLYRVDITGFNEQRVVTPAHASDPAWSPLLVATLK